MVSGGWTVNLLRACPGIVGHRGSSADGGHYIGYVRRDVFEEVDKRNYDDPATDQWVKFDDDKVRRPAVRL